MPAAITPGLFKYFFQQIAGFASCQALAQKRSSIIVPTQGVGELSRTTKEKVTYYFVYLATLFLEFT